MFLPANFLVSSMRVLADVKLIVFLSKIIFEIISFSLRPAFDAGEFLVTVSTTTLLVGTGTP